MGIDSSFYSHNKNLAYIESSKEEIWEGCGYKELRQYMFEKWKQGKSPEVKLTDFHSEPVYIERKDLPSLIDFILDIETVGYSDYLGPILNALKEGKSVFYMADW